ncbi:acyl carrier protein [Variovorax sp. GT1P44]|uniref:acyl carrier protein n=1 Tax=Variovorax sp. GT1P44 TaxID=3443742 RepID=UPI003F45E73F
MIEQDTLAVLTDQVRKALARDIVEPDVAIGELGFDSMGVVELIVICEQIYGTSIDPASMELTQYTTLREIDAQFRAPVLLQDEQRR